MGSIAQVFHPSVWSDMLHTGNIGSAAFWGAVLQIVFVNILLSGDNAVVIAMACRSLPRRERIWGMVIGAAVAVLLRLAFTGLVGRLMLLPYLKLAGGVALIYVGAKLLVPERTDRSKVEAVAQLWRAVWVVVVADIVMSLDNVIAVAAIAQGSVLLLAIGLAASIPIILAGAALIMTLIDRLPVLVWAGAGLLGWIAGEVISTDPAISRYIIGKFGEQLAQQVEFASSISVTLLVIAAGGLWRQLRLSHVPAKVSEEVADSA